jgi:hypothetical protein
MRIHTICTEHGTTALVGSGTLLSELECVVCVRIADEAYQASQRPCCSRANIDCCGHDDEDAYRPLFDVAITTTSPGYCGDAFHADAVAHRRERFEHYRALGEDHADAAALAAADMRAFLVVSF